jgi:hypothetical protein
MFVKWRRDEVMLAPKREKREWDKRKHHLIFTLTPNKTEAQLNTF